MTLRNAEEYGVNRKLKRNRDDHVRGKIITISCAQSLDERLYQSNVRYYTQIERIWKLERHTGKNCRNPIKSSRLKAPTNSSINSPPIPMPGSSRSRRYVRYSMPVLAYIVRCNPPASARTCLACASLELKEGVDGSAQHNGELAKTRQRSLRWRGPVGSFRDHIRTAPRAAHLRKNRESHLRCGKVIDIFGEMLNRGDDSLKNGLISWNRVSLH